MIILRLPRALPNGAMDMNDILAFESDAVSSQNESENADEAYFEQVKSQIETVSEATTTNQDTEIGFEIKILERHLLENKV